MNQSNEQFSSSFTAPRIVIYGSPEPHGGEKKKGNLSRYFDLLSRYFDLLSRYFDIITRYFDLLSRYFDLLCRYFDLLSRYFDISLIMLRLVSSSV